MRSGYLGAECLKDFSNSFTAPPVRFAKFFATLFFFSKQTNSQADIFDSRANIKIIVQNHGVDSLFSGSWHTCRRPKPADDKESAY